MNGEPGPAGEPTAEQLTGLQILAMSLIAGTVMITVVLAWTFHFGLDGEPILNDGEMVALLGYGSLVLVPLALVAALVVVPRVQRDREARPTFAAYSGEFFVKAGLLEAPAVLMLIVFLLTGGWVFLGGVAVLLAAQCSIFPTLGKYRTWAAGRTTGR